MNLWDINETDPNLHVDHTGPLRSLHSVQKYKEGLMFQYSDPVGTGLLIQEGALTAYRTLVHSFDERFGRLPNSAYVERDAFLELSGREQPIIDSVTWLAFPRTTTASNEEIDADRFRWQDEYVEWRTEQGAAGNIVRITFTTEFPEYYQALAQVSMAALVRGIQEVIPGANPTSEELFGPNFNPSTATPRTRALRFRNHAQDNPWNNGVKSILFLAQQFNTMSALFNLVGVCSVPRPDLDPSAVCANVGGACGPARNSDPRICQACQNLARAHRGLSLEDPVGIKILELRGIWKINGQQVDINDPAQNQGAWIITRNGQRAVLNVSRGVTIGDDPIISGAQVAANLNVAADVISVRETALPEWARTGREGSRVDS